SAPRALVGDAATVSLATVLVGIGAALATFRMGRWRGVGWGLVLIGAGTGAVSSGSGLLAERATTLAWRAGTARLVAPVAVPGSPVHVQLAPDAGHFAVRTMSPARHSMADLYEFAVGRLTPDSAAAMAPRRVDAEALAFVDSGTMLLLSHADSSGAELRL